MLKRQNRLTTKDYSIKEKGEVLHSPLFRIQLLTKNSPDSKIGIIISKKYFKKSVDRNKLKRKIWYACKEIDILKKDTIKNKNCIIQYINKSKNIPLSIPTYRNIKLDLENL